MGTSCILAQNHSGEWSFSYMQFNSPTKNIRIQAFCYKEMAKNEMKDFKKCITLAHTSADLYHQAAEAYPLDEERRACKR